MTGPGPRGHGLPDPADTRHGVEDDPADVPPPVADPVTGQVWVLSRKCDTCIFAPGNLMYLHPGALAGMVGQAIGRGGHIVCHSTLPGTRLHPGPAGICRGFADAHGHHSLALRLATALGTIRDIDPPASTCDPPTPPDPPDPPTAPVSPTVP